ncbi:thioredoxin-like domain-containing protein [Bacteroidota bacterium]
MLKTLIIFLVFNSLILTQSVSVKINGLDTATASLSYLEGEKIFFLDSLFMSNEGMLQFNFPDNYHTGFYRLTLGKDRWINFICDGEDIILETDFDNILDNMKVISSESNSLYYSFVKLNKLFKTKTELLHLILARYPRDDDYYFTTQHKLAQTHNEYTDFVNIVSQNNPQKFISRYIKSARLPAIDKNIPLEKQLDYLKLHALDNVDFNDAELIYSDCFTNKTIEYLTYYRNPNFPKELLEEEFITAVDTILNKAKTNQLVYNHITEYLIDGFKKFGFDHVIDYILENYVVKDDLCLDEETENSIQRRINQSKLLPINAVAPNIILPDTSGELINLADIEADKILIVFYASWCPHCKDLLPQLTELYNNQTVKSLNVISVSLDTDRSEWLNFIKSNNLNWVNVSDLKGWNSKAASDYYIYATPTMFLVDRERNIIGKPLNINEVKSLLR